MKISASGGHNVIHKMILNGNQHFLVVCFMCISQLLMTSIYEASTIWETLLEYICDI